MMLMLVFLNCLKFIYSFNFSRKISKERETELEKLFTENQENILDLQELKSSLSKSYEVKKSSYENIKKNFIHFYIR